MRVSGLIKAGAAALALFAAATPGAATADVADLYKGKTLTILIGHPPGVCPADRRTFQQICSRQP